MLDMGNLQLSFCFLGLCTIWYENKAVWTENKRSENFYKRPYAVIDKRMIRFAAYITAATPNHQQLPFHVGDLDPYLIHGSFRPHESAPLQMASRLVQPFLQGSRTWFTDRHTDRPRYSVCGNRPHLAVTVTVASPSHAVRPSGLLCCGSDGLERTARQHQRYGAVNLLFQTLSEDSSLLLSLAHQRIRGFAFMRYINPRLTLTLTAMRSNNTKSDAWQEQTNSTTSSRMRCR